MAKRGQMLSHAEDACSMCGEFCSIRHMKAALAGRDEE